MRAILLLVVTGVLLTGCAQMASVGMDQRDRVMDRISAEWCGMTGAQRQAAADARGYSDEFVAWLDSTCDQ